MTLSVAADTELFPTGHVVTFTVTDDSGNSSSTTLTVTDESLVVNPEDELTLIRKTIRQT